MKKIYCIKCNNQKKFKSGKVPYIVLSIICSKTCERWKIFKEEESIEILTILGLIKNMVKCQINL